MERSTSKAQSSGQRWLLAIHLWFQDSESADRSGSPGAGLWAVTTDTSTNQELSLKQYQLDRVTGDGENRIARHQGCVYVLMRMCVCVCVCITEYKTVNAEAASADSRGSSEISSVTLEKHAEDTRKNKFLILKVVWGNSRLRQTQTC